MRLFLLRFSAELVQEQVCHPRGEFGSAQSIVAPHQHKELKF